LNHGQRRRSQECHACGDDFSRSFGLWFYSGHTFLTPKGFSDAFREAIARHQLFEELGIQLDYPPALLSDNQGAFAITEDPAQHHKTKHIRVRYHFIRDAYHFNRLRFHPLITLPTFSRRRFVLPLIYVTVLLWACFNRSFTPTFTAFFPHTIHYRMHALSRYLGFCSGLSQCTHAWRFRLLGALPLVIFEVFASFFLVNYPSFFLALHRSYSSVFSRNITNPKRFHALSSHAYLSK
jgi:hypothetical protein